MPCTATIHGSSSAHLKHQLVIGEDRHVGSQDLLRRLEPLPGVGPPAAARDRAEGGRRQAKSIAWIDAHEVPLREALRSLLGDHRSVPSDSRFHTAILATAHEMA